MEKTGSKKSRVHVPFSTFFNRSFVSTFDLRKRETRNSIACKSSLFTTIMVTCEMFDLTKMSLNLCALLTLEIGKKIMGRLAVI